jgi:hypothetical protein
LPAEKISVEAERRALAEQLDVPFVTSPGHHASYTDAAAIDAWVTLLREALHEL